MQLNKDSLMTRLAVGVTALALAMGAAACASDDGDTAAGGNADASPASDARDASAATGSDDKGQINAVYEEFVEHVYAQDGKQACSLMTAKAQKDFGAGKSCAKRIETQFTNLSKERPRIYELRVQGNRAEARAGSPKTQKYPVPFTKDNGTWKISGGF